MSLDNVLAVAGAAKDHPTVLIIGLLLSVILMGVAANMVAHLLHKHRWIGWIGLAIITYVALDMIWRGSEEVLNHTAALGLSNPVQGSRPNRRDPEMVSYSGPATQGARWRSAAWRGGRCWDPRRTRRPVRRSR